MKILQITPYYLPHIGGIERYVNNLCRHLVNKGHEIEIHTSNIPNTVAYGELDGIVIRRFKSLAAPFRNPLVPRFLFPDKRYLKDFDLIHAHMLYSTAALYAIKIKNILGIPLIVTHHGRMRFKEGFKDVVVDLYEKTFFKSILSNADRIIVLSDSDAEFFQSLGQRTKVNVIPNGLDDKDIIKFSTDGQLLTGEINFNNKKIILYVGRIIPHKGVLTLLNAILNHSEKFRNFSVKFIFIGDGNQTRKMKKIVIKNQLSDLIHFTGSISDKQLFQFYKNSYSFVLPSFSEGFPTTVLEAMYFGVPVIATNIPVMKQYFSDSAILVPPGDEQALANAILTLLDQPDKREILSERGRRRVREEFTWDKIARKYLDCYDEVLSNESSNKDPNGLS